MNSPGLDRDGLAKAAVVLFLFIPAFAWIVTAKQVYGFNPDNIRQVLPFLLKNTFSIWQLWGALLGGFALASGLFFLLVKYNKKVFKGAHFHRFYRGTALVTQEALARLTKEKKKKQITIADIPVPTSAESKHFAIGGATGTGKTTVMKEMMYGVMKRGDKQVILDPDGEFLETFYRPGDVILNPYDERSVGWSFFNEIRNEYDFNRYARSMIVQSNSAESEEWNDYGRLLFREVARKVYQTSTTPNMGEVFKWTNRSTMEELEEFAEGTEAQALFTGNDRASSSVRFVLSNKLAPHLIMPAGGFSLTDWLEDDSSKTLFITWTEATRAALQPMISCWVDTIVQIVLGRRSHQGADVWMWLDELESLGHLPTLGAGLTRGRKKGLRIVSGYQSYSQIVDVYGENLAETMLTNHRSNIVFAVGRQGKATADRMSNALGEHEVMRERPEKSYRWGEWATRSNRREVQRERVVMPSEIMALDDLHGYVSFPGSLPVANFKVEPINFKRSQPVPAIVPVSEMRQFGDVNA